MMIATSANNHVSILLRVDKSFIPKAEYVLRTFCRNLGLSPNFYYDFALEQIDIAYGSELYPDASINIWHNKQAVSFFSQPEDLDRKAINRVLYMGEYIPFLFGKPGPISHLHPHAAEIGKDIIASAFYFLSCWQEHVYFSGKNHEDRYPYRLSVQHALGLKQVPVVDRYCEILASALSWALPRVRQSQPWGKNHDFCVSVSHDLDYYNYWDKQTLSSTLEHDRKRFFSSPVKAAYKLLGHFIDKRILRHGSAYHNKRLLNTEKRFKLKSTWFVLTGNDQEDPRQNYFEDPDTRTQVLKLLENNSLGLHVSPAAAFSQELMTSQLSTLQQEAVVWGTRLHWLYFRYQKTFKVMEAAGVYYDCSLGWRETIGYRAGTGYPFYPFDLEQNRPFRVMEIPLVVMDTALYSKTMRNLSARQAYRLISKLFTRAALHGTHVSLLWHNNSFDSIDYPGWGRLWGRLLKKAKKMGARVCSADDLYKYWAQK